MDKPNDKKTNPTTTTTTTVSIVTPVPSDHPNDVAAPLGIAVNDHLATDAEAPAVITAERLHAAVAGANQTGTGTPEACQRKRPKRELARCEVCCRLFNSAASLRLHMRYHPEISMNGRAPPPSKRNRKDVQSKVDKVKGPENTAEREIIDLTAEGPEDGGVATCSPPPGCRIYIDLNLPPPEEDDEDDDLGGSKPALVV